LKVAVIQLGAGNNKEKNIKKALCLIRKAAAKKAKFILLPEAFNFRGKADAQKGFSDIAETIPGPSTKALMDAARAHGVTILAGSVCERVSEKKKTYNTSVLIDDRGRISARYRKIHLFHALIGKTKVRESQYLSSGRKAVTAKMGSWTIGLSVCYDLRFPDLYQKYVRAGADILCVPSAFTKMTGRAHWEVLLRARAIENFCYVLAPNQIGKDGRGITHYGNSMIVDPWGRVLARASGGKEEIIFARINKALIKKERNVLAP